jgi:hypothetical protein
MSPMHFAGISIVSERAADSPAKYGDNASKMDSNTCLSGVAALTTTALQQFSAWPERTIAGSQSRGVRQAGLE